MNRRDLLKCSALAGSTYVLGSGLVPPARGQACWPARLPGVQLYTIRDLLGNAPEAALTSLAELGIGEVELFGLDASRPVEAQLFGMTSQQLLDALRRTGLEMSIAHVWGNWRDTDGIGRIADELELETLVLGLPEIFADTRDGVFNMVKARNLAELDTLAGELNRAASEYRTLGLAFAYHNHHVEFIPVEGNVPFDYLMQRTDPELLSIEIDIGWVGAAGLDPADLVRRYASRIVSCHLKDFDGRMPLGDEPHHQAVVTAIVEPGAGTIDFRPVLDALEQIPIGHGFIEIDVSASPLEAIERGYRYLRRIRGCTAPA